MSNVLLVEPLKNKAWGANQQYIGLLKIGAWLKDTGHNVEYVSGLVEPNIVPDEIYVTSMFTYWYKEVWETVKYYKAKFPNAKVKLGGIYATLCPDHAKMSGADEVIVGQIPDAVKYAPDPTLIKPKPKFAYCMTSYGCSGNCTFCATHILYGQGIRQREPDEVLNELELQRDRGFDEIYFGDDDLGYNADNHLVPILNGMLDRKLKFKLLLYGGMQARSLTPDIAVLMRKAGFKQISLGWETVNEEVRKRMGRAFLGTNDVLTNAIGYLKKAKFVGSDITVFFMIGLPYQTLDDMLDTMFFLAKLGVWIQPQRWAPIPGTPDFKYVVEKHGLQNLDLADFYYKDFLCPGQDNFTDKDLNDIYKIARCLNMGFRYSQMPLLVETGSKVHRLFIEHVKKSIYP